jgi:hypothetical protein
MQKALLRVYIGKGRYIAFFIGNVVLEYYVEGTMVDAKCLFNF